MNWIKNSFSRNMLTRPVGLFLTAFLVFSNLTYSQVITDEQKLNLETKIKLLMKDYAVFNQFSVDGVNISSDYAKQFIALFETPSKTGIFNDLAPTGKGTFQSPELYVNFVRQFYPQGLDITLDLDKLTVVETTTTKDGKFKIFTYINKRIVGIYNNQNLYKFNNDLCFVFTALPDGKGGFSSLKIDGVITKEKYAQNIQNSKGKGIYLGVAGMYSQTRINDVNISNSGIWNESMGTSIIPEFELTFMFTRGFGLGTGIRLSKYSTAFTINNYNQTSSSKITDEDGDTYNPVLQISELTDNRTISSTDIPILLKFRMGKAKTKFTLDLGVIYSMFSEASYTLNGAATRAGYYSEYNVILNDITEYGFGTFNYTEKDTYEMTMPSSGLSGYAGIGLQFQLAPFMFLNIGTALTYGITPIGMNTDDSDNYFNYTLENPADKASLQLAGAKIGLTFKIL